MTIRRNALLILAALIGSHALAADLAIQDPWVRGTVPAQKATGAFMRITGKTSTIITGASSPVAGVVELHEMAMHDNTMVMRPITRLEVPAGGTVELKPGSYHIMLMDLKQPLATGQKVPITLQVDSGGKRESIEVQAEVRSLTGQPATMAPHPASK